MWFQRNSTQTTHSQQMKSKNWEKTPKHCHPLNTQNFLIAIEIKDKTLSDENKIEHDLSNTGRKRWVKLCHSTSNGISMLMLHLAEIFICAAKSKCFRHTIKIPSSRLKNYYHGSHSCFSFSCYLDWPSSHNLLLLLIIAALL